MNIYQEVMAKSVPITRLGKFFSPKISIWMLVWVVNEPMVIWVTTIVYRVNKQKTNQDDVYGGGTSIHRVYHQYQ